MRLVSFVHDDHAPHFGVLVDDHVIEIGESDLDTLTDYLQRGTPRLEELAAYVAEFKQGNETAALNHHPRRFTPLAEVSFTTPIYPTSLRDFYAFEQHVAASNKRRGRDVPPAWYEIPVFYFSNTSMIYGDGDTIPYPGYSDALDYELEIAAVIGKSGINIPAEQAEDYIFGFTIMNDWSARDEQRREMSVGLGPAKGKDFATSFGPCIATLDEFVDRRTDRPGVYDLEMVARVNGVERSRGNMKDLYWSFGQMIERASQDAYLRPGDVIGSGTVGTGCLLELTEGQGPWLQPGDVIELEIERLGILKNTVGEKP